MTVKEVKELWNIFIENLKTILTVAIWLGLIGLIYGGLIRSPEYESSAKVLLVNEGQKVVTDKNDISLMQGQIALNQELISTYREIVKSRLVLEKVIDELELDIPLEVLRNDIKVSIVEETEVLDIAVKTSDPILSNKIVNQLVESFKNEVFRIYKISNVQIVDKPVLGKYNFRISAIKFGIIFSIIGVILTYSLYFIKFIFNNKISKLEDLEEFNVNLLGNIPISIKNEEKEGE